MRIASFTNNLCRLFCLMVFMGLSASVEAQDQEVEEFSQKTVFLKGKKGYEADFSIQYIAGHVAVERYAAKYFFDDSVSTSLTDAIAVFALTFDKDVFDREKNAIVGGYRYQMHPIDGHQGKYQCYFLKRVVREPKGKKKEVTKTKQCGIVYDVKNDRVLTAQDVFTEDYLKHNKIKTRIDMYMNDMSVVWNFPKTRETHRVYYHMNPESFTEEFRQLLDWEKVTARSGRITTQGGMGNGTVYASVQEVARHTSAIADANNGEVLKAKEVVVDGKPQYEGKKVYDMVEQMPEFPGGPVALMKWLNENIKYPSIAEENGIQGRVVCSFIVETDGSFSNLEVVRSIDPSLDKEAVRVLKKMPKWNPGKQNGSSVRVKYIVPVTFMLQPAVKKSPQRVTR